MREAAGDLDPDPTQPNPNKPTKQVGLDLGSPLPYPELYSYNEMFHLFQLLSDDKLHAS